MTTTPHPYKSERSEILVEPETSQKTEATPTRYPGFIQQADQELPDVRIDWLAEQVVGGNRNPYQLIEGAHSFSDGSLTLAPYDGWPIAWLLGSDAVTSTTSAPYTHTIAPKHDGAPPTATVEGNYISGSAGSDMSRGFLGVVPNQGTIRIGNDSKLLVDLDLEALGPGSGTADGTRSPTTGISLPDREPWRFSKTNSDLSMFGTAFARVENFRYDVVNAITPERYVESSEAPEPYEVLYGNGDWQLLVDLAVVDSSLYEELAGPTSGGFEATITLEKNNGNETAELSGLDSQISAAPHPVPEEGKVISGVELIIRQPEFVITDSVTDTAYI